MPSPLVIKSPSWAFRIKIANAISFQATADTATNQQ